MPSEEVVLQRIAFAEGVAALTHGQLMPGGKALMNLHTALLAEDLAAGLHASTTEV